MILSRDKLKLVVAVLVLLGIGLHIYFLPSEPEEKTLRFAGVEELGRYRAQDYSPALQVCSEGFYHFVGLVPMPSRELKYISFDLKMNKEFERTITLPEEMEIEYIFPLGNRGGEVVFGLVSREERASWPYILVLSGEDFSFSRLSFPIPREKDISGEIVEGEKYLFYVNREGGVYNLFLQKEYGEKILIDSSEEYIGLPRFVIDEENGYAHLQWKGIRDNLGVSRYQIINLAEEEPLFSEPEELGFASRYFGEQDRQPVFFEEDPGADLIIDGDGNVFIAWTHSIYEPSTQRMESEINMVRLNLEGEIQDHWKIRNMPFFGSLYLEEGGRAGYIWEDYFGGQFRLRQTNFHSEGLLAEPWEISDPSGSHRLPRVVDNGQGDYVMLWREIDRGADLIRGKSSLDKSGSAWYDEWDLWFIREGVGNSIMESLLILLFSGIMAFVNLAQNFIFIGFLAFLLYFLQSRRILGRINFFLYMGIFLGLVTFFREYISAFYNLPFVEQGFLLFSAFVATGVVVFVARRNWFKGGEELLYLNYSLLWMFTDAFLIYLATSPQSFIP